MASLNFLLDTNILSAVEPTAPSPRETMMGAAAELARRINEHHHRALLHPAGVEELGKDGNQDRRKLREVLVKKYAKLPSPPHVADSLTDKVGQPHDDNEHVDNLMLAAVVGNAVHYLVSEDRGLHYKARMLGVSDRVLRVSEALELLGRLHPGEPAPPPRVERRVAHQLDLTDPFFDSFREDYPFDEWFPKAQREQRPCWVIERDGALAGLCLVKDETSRNDLGLGGPTLKISSLKVSAEHSGFRFGELLLRAAFIHAAAAGYEHIYLSAYDHHESLIRLLEEFGFQQRPEIRTAGEHYFHKTLRPEADNEHGDVAPLDHHRRYGPPALPPDPPETYLVPIEGRYHRLLFPDAETQLQLAVADPPAYSNAIRKAYLCRASTRQLEAGGVIAFYQSGSAQSVAVIGVVEATFRGSDPAEIVQFVGNRTVYALEEIERMCSESEVLGILFRHDRVLSRPVTLADLRLHGAVQGAPQSTMRVREEGKAWLHKRIGL